jgi:hypothetical protein
VYKVFFQCCRQPSFLALEYQTLKLSMVCHQHQNGCNLMKKSGDVCEGKVGRGREPMGHLWIPFNMFTAIMIYILKQLRLYWDLSFLQCYEFSQPLMNTALSQILATVALIADHSRHRHRRAHTHTHTHTRTHT